MGGERLAGAGWRRSSRGPAVPGRVLEETVSRHVPGQPGLPGQPAAAGPYPAKRLAGLIARQPLVLVVGPPGPGRAAALTVLAGPAAGGTMIDLGALWMAVDPPGDRPRTVRLNGAPSTVGRRGWEAIAGAIGAVAVPPSVVLVDTFQGLVAALGAAGAAETINALVLPGRTVVVVLDESAEMQRFGALAARHGVIVSVDGPVIREVRPVADPSEVAVGPLGAVPPGTVSLGSVPPGRQEPAASDEPGAPSPRRPWPPLAEPAEVGVPEAGAGAPEADEWAGAPGAGAESAADRRRRWWRRSSQPAEPAEPVVPGQAVRLPTGPTVVVAVTDATGAVVERALAPGGYYLIRLRMNAPSGGRGSSEPSVGAWVEVEVIAEAVAVPAGPHAMFVPRDGAAWACPCQPGGPHTCLPEERSETLDLPFVAPRRPDVYPVHIAIRRRATVVHQTRLELQVALDGAGPAPRSTVTYQA
jgi:hypothetical protein